LAIGVLAPKSIAAISAAAGPEYLAMLWLDMRLLGIRLYVRVQAAALNGAEL
jgi:hypothetical protein